LLELSKMAILNTFKKDHTSLLDRAVEVAGVIALVFLWMMTYYFQQKGLQAVPEQYDFLDQPNEFWASKITYSIPFVVTIVYLIITYTSLKKSEPDDHPYYSPEKAAAFQVLNKRLWRWMKLSIILVFIMIEYFSFHTGSRAGEGISYWYFLFFPVLLIGPAVFFLIEISKKELE